MGSKLAGVLVAVVAMTAPGAAHAAPGGGGDWLKLIYDVDAVARGNFDKATKNALPSALPASEDPNPENLGNAWFGVAPTVTLVARDWRSSMRLAGDRLSLVDAMRLSASTRMVVGRARWSGSRFTPFLQIGIGQWRVDHTYLPLTPNTEDVAGQWGGGFELRMTRGWQVAAETSATTLLRESQNNSVPQTMLWSAFVASRVEF
jgi:hypothetical protein